MLAPRFSLALLAPLALAGTALAQTTWYVDVHATPPGDGSQGSPYTSIQYAVNRPTTVMGDTLEVAPGVYNGSVDVPKIIRIHGSQGAAHTVIQGRVVYVGGAGGLEGLTLRGVTADFSLWPITIEGCVLRGTNSGIGVDIGFATVYLRRSSVINHNFGFVVSGGNGVLEMENSIVAGNQQNHWGSYTICADYCAGQLPPSNCGLGTVMDPGLWGASFGDAHLVPGSACIDAADPNLPPDPDGSPADIGALPYEPGYVPVASVYCNSQMNSSGCPPTIRVDGLSSVTQPQAFQVGAVDLIADEAALLWYSLAGPANTFAGGSYKHCTLAPRTLAAVVQASGASATPCSGIVSFDFNALAQSGADPALTAGTVVYAHWWYRDPLLPAGGGWTNAVRFGIGL